MVRWCPDDKGRFNKRPFYKADELDAECEALLAEFRRSTGRKSDVAIDTDDMTVMIERHVGDLDVYADLSEDGPEAEGVTLFAAQRKPDIAIAERLTSDDRRSNRFRTTLAHELGHVILHDPLYQEKLAMDDLFAVVTEERLICKRDTMVDAPMGDWMEWQACYFSGALLMPRRAMIDLAKEHGDGIAGAPASARIRAPIWSLRPWTGSSYRTMPPELGCLSSVFWREIFTRYLNSPHWLTICD